MKYLKSIREFVETGDGLINAKMHELKDLVSNISDGQNIIYEWQNEDDHRLSVNFSTGNMSIKYEFDIDKLHIVKIAGDTMDFETDVESIDEGLEIIERDIQMILGISENIMIKNYNDLIDGETYKITYPCYDDYLEDLKAEVETCEIIRKNRFSYLVRDVDHNYDHELRFDILKECEIEHIID